MAVSEWENSCRLCSEKQNEMFLIFGEEGLQRKVAHKLRKCLPLMVYQADPLPKKICQFCAARLDDVYEFREYCLSVYKTMHQKLLSRRDLKAVQIYMDAMKNSPDPCQVQLCKEKSRAPPPLVPLPVSLPIPKSVESLDDAPLPLTSGVEPLPELPCMVEIQEDTSDILQNSHFECSTNGETSMTRTKNRLAKNDVIVLETDFIEGISSDAVNNHENRKSILEQVLTGNLMINNSSEISPKSKLTSQWWCSPCNSYYRNKSSLVKHMQLFCPRTYTCSKCSRGFRTVEELAKHEATDHLKVTFDFDESLKECHQCDRKFVSWEMLRQHRLRDHVAGTGESGANTRCPICNRSFPSIELYQSHKQLHDAETAQPEVTVMPEKSRQNRGQTDDTKKEEVVEAVKSLACPTCGKVCTQQSALSNHMRTHEPKKHKCEDCGRCFGLFIRLAAHRITEHGHQAAVSPIVASVEQEEALNAEREAREARITTSKSNVRRRKNIEILAREETPMEDENAANRTSDAGNASKNVARCGICQKWFNDHTTMLSHLRTHSASLGNPLFICGICNKTFKEKWQLTRHELSHKRGTASHACKTCDKTFADKRQLKSHQAIHSLNKTYHCPKCNKIFFKEFSLITHQCSGTPQFGKRNLTPGKITGRKASSSASGGAKKRNSATPVGNSTPVHDRSRKSSKESANNHNNAFPMELDDEPMPKLASKFSEVTPASKTEINDAGSPAQTPVKRTLIRTSGGYRCGVCQSPFVLRELAVAHLRSAHPVMPYQCPYCKKHFTTQYTFTHHMKNEHPDESEK